MSSFARVRILSLSASIVFGENALCNGARNLVCSGGSRLIGTAEGICGVPGGRLAMSAFICASVTNWLLKDSVSREAPKLALWLKNIQWPPLRGVQNTGGAVRTSSRTRL